MKTTNESDQRYRNTIDANLQDMHTSLGEMAAADESHIASFYAGKSIFVTGATGFMGKVLLEKLLRSCSDVKNIYILLRSKKGVEPKIRLNELLSSKVFDRVRANDPSQLTKIVMVAGDITLPGLGISDVDTEVLIKEVSIVFHSAATVKFDEPMRTSINFNTLGTRHVLELCHKIKKLDAFVHVSTAYSNCNLHDVEEQFYPTPAPPQKIIELTEWMDDETLDAITPKLLGNRPNTYTYTKALAESLLQAEGSNNNIPMAIVRPSIVTAAWREPYPGWVDNINGPTGMVLAVGKGLLRTMLSDSKACADLIPVDMVINLMITVAWYTATRRPNSIRIYNCTSGTLNSIKWGDIERITFPLLLKYPSIQVFRYPEGNFKESRFYNQLCCVWDHHIPAYVIDTIMRITGNKPILVRIYEKLHRAIAALQWFTTRDWNFKSSNVLELSQELEGIDQKVFHFDVRNLHWESYWKDYIMGIRKFILKEDDDNLPVARTKLKRVYYTHKLVQFLLLFALWHIFLARTPLVQRVCTTLISSAVNFCSQFFTSSLFSSPPLQTSALTNSNITTAALQTNQSTSTLTLQSFSSSIITVVATIAGLPTYETSSLSST